MIENSVIYLFMSSIGNRFISSIKNSALVNFFLRKANDEEICKNSIFYKAYLIIRQVFLNIFKIFRLDKLLKGSIFKLNFLWMSITLIFAPFMPTMLVLLMSLAGFLSLILRLFSEDKFQLKFNSLNKFVYLYAVVYAFAIVTSVNVRGSLFGGLLTICFVLFSIVVINSIETKNQIRILNFLLVCGGILVSLYGFYQFMYPDRFGGSWVDQEMFEGMFRVYSTFQNPNVLGEYFLLIIPISVACFFIAKPIIIKLFYLGATGLMMLCLVLTYSRGCYIGIIVAAAIFAVLLDKRFIFLGIIVVLLLPFFLPETIINRFLSIGNMEDSSTSYRVYIWMGTIAMLKDYWFSGIGPGEAAYNIIYPMYGYNGISAPHSHNTFLQVMCDTGFMGIIMFVVVLYQYYKALFISYTETTNKEERILTIAGISYMSGFLVQSLFDYTFYNYRVLLLFWAFVGLGIVYSRFSTLKEA